MRREWTEAQARRQEMEAFAQRLELRLHAIALVITALVMAMRLLAGADDLTLGETSDDPPLAGGGAHQPPLGL